MRWTYETVVQAPPATVFALVTDLDLIPRWEDDVLTLQPVSGLPLRLGSTFAETRMTLGRRMDILLQVTRYVQDREFGVEAIGGPIAFSGVRLLEPVADGTRIREYGTARLPWFLAILGPLLTLAAKRANDRSYDRIRALAAGPLPGPIRQ